MKAHLDQSMQHHSPLRFHQLVFHWPHRLALLVHIFKLLPLVARNHKMLLANIEEGQLALETKQCPQDCVALDYTIKTIFKSIPDSIRPSTALTCHS